jgi:hypothetical protein
MPEKAEDQERSLAEPLLVDALRKRLNPCVKLLVFYSLNNSET